MATRTRSFGAGNREAHDAAPFYERFTAPDLSDDETVNPCPAADQLFCADARDMRAVDDSSVALVVTSPPYFAGKEYEAALGEGDVPGSYLEYLEMLRDVFAECRRGLEPGGRIAVNVANLGRKPYRSLAGDVTTILQDDLGLLAASTGRSRAPSASGAACRSRTRSRTTSSWRRPSTCGASRRRAPAAWVIRRRSPSSSRSG